MNWINLQEQQPSYGQECLAYGRVLMDSGQLHPCKEVYPCDYLKSGFCSIEYTKLVVEVKYWMPYPEAPKE